MPVILNLEDKIIGLIRNERYKWFTTGVNLGGVTGASGGTGGPLGGFVGQLIQSKVTYDTSEAESLTVPVSGSSLVHNLNRIRYRIATLESGGGISYITVKDEGIDQGNVTILDFKGTGVTATVSGSTATITVSGGGGVASYLDDLLDVTVITPSGGDVLYYDSVTSGWINQPSSIFAASGHFHTEAHITDLEHDAVKLQGRDIATTAPTAGQSLAWNQVATQWEPTTISGATTVLEYAVYFEDLSTQVPGSGFDLTYPPVTNTLQVHVNGLLQQPDNYYMADSDTFILEFTTVSGEEVLAQYIREQGTFGIDVYDDSVLEGTALSELDFIGGNVTVSGIRATITISGGGAGHDEVTVVDTSSLNLELTEQALSGYVIPGGVDHDQLLNFASNEHFTEASIDHLNIQNIGSNAHTAIDAHIASGYIHTPSGHIHDERYYTESEVDGLLHSEVTVADTASLNLELTGQALSGYVIPGGISHTDIADIGTNAHSVIDSHIADTSIHFDELGELSNVSAASPDTNDSLVWTGSIWAPLAISGGASGQAYILEDLTNQVPDAGDDFWLANTLMSGSLRVYYNGLLQQPTNYAETSASGFHTYFSPVTNDELFAEYLVNDLSGSAVVGTIQVEEDDSVIQQRVAILNFEGSGLESVVDEGSNKVTVTVSGGGVADHGALTGLADDDHPQYAASGHLHDSRYYTETEIDVWKHDAVTISDTASLNLELTDQALSGYVIEAGVDHDQLLNFASNEHFTEASIDHTNILNIGTTSHDDIDAHIASGYIHTPSGHLHDNRYYTETEIDVWKHDAASVVDTSSINLELTGQAVSGYVIPGGVDHDQLLNFTSNEHFTEGSIDHTNIQNIGTNSHDVIDAHLASGSIHFTEGSISHLNIQDIGTNAHSAIDTHIADTSIHFDELAELSNVSAAAPDVNDSLVWTGSVWAPVAISGGAGVGQAYILEDLTNQVPDTGDDFWLANTIMSGSLRVYYNGLIQQPTNYAETSASGFHTYFSPVTNDELFAQYLVDDLSGSAVVGTIQVEEDDSVIQQRVAILNFEGVQSVVDEGSNKVTVTISGGAGGHDPVTISDTASVDLSLTGQLISATVLPAGVDHGTLGGIADDDHTQYGHLSQAESVLGQWNFHSNLEQRGYYGDTTYVRTTISGGLYHVTDSSTGFDSTAVLRGNVVNIQGNAGQELLELDPSEATFNDPGNDVDFRIESNNVNDMLFVDGGSDQIAIGTPTADQHESLTISNIGKKAGGGTYDTSWINEYTGMTIGAAGSDPASLYFLALRGDTTSIYNNIGTNVYWNPESGDISWHKRDASKAGLTYEQRLLPTDVGHGFWYLPSGTTSLYSLADFSDSEAVFNDAARDINFRVEGTTSANLLFADATLSRVGIGQGTPEQLLHVGSGSGPVTLKLDSGASSRVTQIEFDRGTQTWLGPTAGNEFHLWSAENIPLVFASNNAESFRISATEVVVNDNAQDVDFRVESDWATNPNPLWVDGEFGYIVFGDTDTTRDKDKIVFEPWDPEMIMYSDLQSKMMLWSTNTTATWPSVIRFQKTRGSLGTPSAVSANDELGSIIWHGQNDVDVGTGNAEIVALANETFTEDNEGTRLEFRAMADSTGTLSTYMTLQTGLQLGSPTGGDKGAGTLNVATDAYKNNSAYTNPDFVLEHWATGEINKYKDSPGANEYQAYTITEVMDYAKEHHRLPGISDEPMGIFDRGDKALEWIERMMTYIGELEERITELENDR
jgi:hypothetical protein